MNRPAIDLIGSDSCTGCGACDDACSKNAIDILPDPDGFLRPVVDRGRCTECGDCAQHCPVIVQDSLKTIQNHPIVFGGWSNAQAARAKSSSGGLSYELSLSMLEQGGVVVGCTMEGNLLPRLRLIRTPEDLALAQGSKYLPSDASGVYQAAKKEAESGRNVLFLGLPCQVAAFATFLTPAFRENVLLVDVVCYGIPSMLPWQKHVESFHGMLKQVNFRDETGAWTRARIKYDLSDGSTVSRRYGDDPFMAGYMSTAYHQLICHSCPFAGWPRSGDITLGDFWGVPRARKDERGVSLIIASTPRGLAAIDRLTANGRVTVFESNVDVAEKGNPRLGSSRPIEKPHPRRREVLSGLQTGQSLEAVSALYRRNPLRRLQRHFARAAASFIMRWIADA